jgi:hypothetical protein
MTYLQDWADPDPQEQARSDADEEQAILAGRDEWESLERLEFDHYTV